MGLGLGVTLGGTAKGGSDIPRCGFPPRDLGHQVLNRRMRSRSGQLGQVGTQCGEQKVGGRVESRSGDRQRLRVHRRRPPCGAHTGFDAAPPPAVPA